MDIISVYALAGGSYMANLPYKTLNRRHIRKTSAYDACAAAYMESFRIIHSWAAET